MAVRSALDIPTARGVARALDDSLIGIVPDADRPHGLFPRQMRFVKSEARYPAYIGGLGSGKSYAGASKVLARIGRPELGMIGAPTFQMLRDSTLRGFFELLQQLRIPYTFQRGENTVRFASGHEILCRSLDDPNHVRGPNLDYAWVDEAGYIDGESWRIVKGRVRIGVLPQAWQTGTPKGRNYQWEEWERDATGDELDATHPLYRVSTSENPTLPDGFAAGLGYTGRFAEQELGGLFVAFEGLVYPNFHRRSMRVVNASGWRTVMGVDVGTRNPTAILTVRAGNDVERYVEREFYQRNMSSDEILTAICEEADAVKPEHIFVDPSASAYILALKRRGYPAQAANNEVVYGIGVVESALHDGLVLSPEAVHTAAEFESYSYPEGKGRGDRDKPTKQNDHAMDALRYSLVALADRPRSFDRMHESTYEALEDWISGV